jgi:hypothetical protein
MTPIRDEFDRWLEEEAPGLRQHWDSPELWPRIAGSLEAERKHAPLPHRRPWLAAAAALLLLAAPAALVYRAQPRDPLLLTEEALADVRSAERAYAQSIDRLAERAVPRLEDRASPLIASYREKLLLLDDAIATLQAEAGRNPYNQFLRNELLALYREKQKTLEGILHDDQKRIAP